MVKVTRDSVLKNLKKKIGEKCAQAVCNAGLWLVPNIQHIMEFAGQDEKEIEQVIKVLREIYMPQEEIKYNSDLDPLTLLDMAGYKAWYVNNEQEQNAIAGYFRDNRSVKHGMTGGNTRTDKHELICTIHNNWDSGEKRFDKYYIIHAVKKEVFGDDKLPESEWHIKPSDNPEREDPYGTSVISIQILKTGGLISIKNRYNHTLEKEHPDHTFNNNPDNIIIGLSDSLRKHFNVDFTITHAVLPYNFQMIQDRVVRFNYEINNIYFGPNYYSSGGTITKLKDDDSQVLFYRGFMLNIAKGNSHITSVAGVENEFCHSLDQFIQGKKIRVMVAEDKTKTILLNNERFMDIKDGVIKFINMPTLDALKLVGERVQFSGDLDFSGVRVLDLSKVDLSNVNSIKFNPNAELIFVGKGLKLSGDLDFSGVRVLDLSKVDLSNVNSIKFNPNAELIFVGKELKLSGDLDFSGVKHLNLWKVNQDLSNVTNIKFNPNADRILIQGNLKLSGNLDFSGVRFLWLDCNENHTINLSDVTNIKFNSHAEQIKLNGQGLKLSGNLDFSGARELSLPNADLSHASSIKLGENEHVDLSNAKLSGDLDFSRVEKVLLNNADLTNVTNIKFNSKANWVFLDGAKLAGDLDFSNITTNLSLENADLTKATSIKFNPSAEFISLKNTKLFGDLDFSGVGQLLLNNADLTDVTSIKFNPKASIIKLSKTKLSGNLDFSGIDAGFLNGADLTNVGGVKFGSTFKLNFDNCKLFGNISFNNINKLKLNYANLIRVSNLSIDSVQETQIMGAEIIGGDPSCDIYLHNLEKIDFGGSDFYNINHIRTGSVRKMRLDHTRLCGNLDLSGVQELDLTNADLTNVRSMKLNPNGIVHGLEPKYKLKFAVLNGAHKLKDKISKVIKQGLTKKHEIE